MTFLRGPDWGFALTVGISQAFSIIVAGLTGCSVAWSSNIRWRKDGGTYASEHQNLRFVLCWIWTSYGNSTAKEGVVFLAPCFELVQLWMPFMFNSRAPVVVFTQPLKLTASPLRMDDWKLNFPFGFCTYFSGARMLVSGKVIEKSKSTFNKAIYFSRFSCVPSNS